MGIFYVIDPRRYLFAGGLNDNDNNNSFSTNNNDDNNDDDSNLHLHLHLVVSRNFVQLSR